MTALSVNLNKIALLRNSRLGDRPSVVEAARQAIDNGALGITVILDRINAISALKTFMTWRNC
jgi:pyridoxine 5'-phosphate synthase PdxJ